MLVPTRAAFWLEVGRNFLTLGRLDGSVCGGAHLGRSVPVCCSFPWASSLVLLLLRAHNCLVRFQFVARGCLQW